MSSRTLLIEGSSTSSPNGGIAQPPVTPYHVIYMNDASVVDRPACHFNFATGGETLDVISGRSANVIEKFAAAPVLNILTLQLGQNGPAVDVRQDRRGAAETGCAEAERRGRAQDRDSVAQRPRRRSGHEPCRTGLASPCRYCRPAATRFQRQDLALAGAWRSAAETGPSVLCAWFVVGRRNGASNATLHPLIQQQANARKS